MEAIIVGGGLGGLSTAIGLGQRGHQVTLLERAKKIAPIGYAVQLGPNVMPILDDFGILEQARGISHQPSAIIMADALSGETVGKIPLGDVLHARYGQPYLCIHRADLHRLMLEAALAFPHVRLLEDMHVSNFVQADGRVTVEVDGKPSLQCDMLVIADGLHSTLRSRIAPSAVLRLANYTAHRTMVPFDKVPPIVRQDEVILWSGAGYHVIYYPLPGYGMNFVAVFEDTDGAIPEESELRRRQLLHRCCGAQPEMIAVLEMMDFGPRWSLADCKPFRGWSEGNATLIGDAAHATLQTLAQGACMAIEDGAVLADTMEAAAGDLRGGIRAFEERRRTRTARVQITSWALWPDYHAADIHRDTRNDEWQARTADDFYRCIDWLWTPPR